MRFGAPPTAMYVIEEADPGDAHTRVQPHRVLNGRRAWIVSPFDYRCLEALNVPGCGPPWLSDRFLARLRLDSFLARLDALHVQRAPFAERVQGRAEGLAERR
jgi:hypothetical protein